MTRAFVFRIAVLLAATVCIASAQDSMSGNQVSLAGPEEITSRVLVLEQPDSPIEVLAIDFTESWLSVYEGGYSRGGRCWVTVRNRGKKPVIELDLNVRYGYGAGPGGGNAGGFQRGESPLLPGQERKIRGCQGYGYGTAPSMPPLRLLVWVEWVDLGDHDFKPSMRIPRESGLRARTF